MEEEGVTREPNKAPKTKPLIVVLVFLGLVILGLVVGIVMVGVNNAAVVGEINEAEREINDIERAMMFTSEINEKLDYDEDYSLDEASFDYEHALNNAEGDFKVRLAIEYSSFLCEKLDNCERGIEIVLSVENIINDQNDFDYYRAVSYFYSLIGDDRLSQLYLDKANQIEGLRFNFNEVIDYVE